MRSIIALLVAAAAAAATASRGSVTLGKDGKFTFHAGVIVSGSLASAVYTDQDDNAKTSGFGQITVRTTAVAGSTPEDQVSHSFNQPRRTAL